MAIPQDGHRYDVFLSFRGFDTRLGFTAYLLQALKKANIEAFYDDDEIETGLQLKPELETAIKESRGSVIVLSENYASSTWCLEELVFILDRNKNSGHKVFPIFYNVEPTNIKKQKESFGDAMAKHRKRMEDETNEEKKCVLTQKITTWEEALTEIATCKGLNAKNMAEPEFIEEIITKVHSELGVLLRSNLPNLIGMDHHIEFISSWLKDGSTHTADILTILGMGGIGKTYLAKYIYGLHSHLFQRSSFIDNINGKGHHEQSHKIQLYSDISKGRSLEVNNVSEYTSRIENALKGKKVLLVLDEVGSLDQLNELLGDTGFHQGGKIIITTKDASLTKKFELSRSSVQPKHTMCLLEGLDETSSMKLFRLHAFGSDVHKEGYEEVSKKIVRYCQGHPQALKVLGRYLRMRSVDAWKECIELLNKEMHSDIATVLRRSFESLETGEDKELFKHIASFFAGRDRVFSETILNACKIQTLNGMKNLTDRFLLKIGPRNELNMHQLLQHFGRDVVCEESPKKPSKRSLLWCQEDSFSVLKEKKDKQNLKGIVFDKRMLEEEKLDRSLVLKTEALSTMYNLKLLHLNYVQLNGTYENFPEELRWLSMHGFHLDCIPPELPMGNLVVLDMSYSKIESFDMSYNSIYIESLGKRRKVTESGSEDKHLLRSLKILNLSFCYKLQIIDGFSKLPALERLILAGCKSLTMISETIEKCDELVVIDLSYCSMLKNLPMNLVELKKLQALSLDGCNLDDFPIDMKDMDLPEMITADRNGINSQASPPIVLNSFAISSLSSLISLSREDNKFQNESFPMEFSSLSMLGKLLLDGNPIVFLPNCVRSLHRIELLTLEECDVLKTMEEPPCTLRNLKISRWDLLQKYVFNPNMSPLAIALNIYKLAHSSVEIEGIVKIQRIADVEEEVLHSLGWKSIDLVQNQEVETWHDLKTGKKSQVQLFYEFGIFSTFYGGKELPNWINDKSTGSSISFIVPSSPSNLRGLNFCHVQTGRDPNDGVNLLTVIVSNITKNRTWIYKHYIHWVKVDEQCLIWLSHWMFGKNEMENGDNVKITITEEDMSDDVSIKECGVSFVYEDGSRDEEKEDALGDYKSWKHIIGGDLSAFRLITGEFLLDNHRFFWWHIDCPVYRSFIANGTCYEEKGLYYRAAEESET